MYPPDGTNQGWPQGGPPAPQYQPPAYPQPQPQYQPPAPQAAPSPPIQPVPGAYGQFLQPPAFPSYSVPPAQFQPPPSQVYYGGTNQPVPAQPPQQHFQPPPYNPAAGFPGPAPSQSQPSPVGPVTYQPPPAAPQPTPAPPPPGAQPPAAPQQHVYDGLAQPMGQTQQPRPEWQPPPFDPAWRAQLTFDEASGRYLGKAGADPNVVRAANEYADWLVRFNEKFNRDPYGAILPGLEGKIEEIARGAYQKTIQEQQDRQTIDSFMQQHSVWLFQRDPQGRPVVNPQTGERVLSGPGVRLAQLAQEAHQKGLTNVTDQIRYAQAMLEVELARRIPGVAAQAQPQAPASALAAQHALFGPQPLSGQQPPLPQSPAPQPQYPATPGTQWAPQPMAPPQMGPSFDAMAQGGYAPPYTPPGIGYTPGVAPYAGQGPAQAQANGFVQPPWGGTTFQQLLERNAQGAGLMAPPAPAGGFFG